MMFLSTEKINQKICLILNLMDSFALLKNSKQFIVELSNKIISLLRSFDSITVYKIAESAIDLPKSIQGIIDKHKIQQEIRNSPIIQEMIQKINSTFGKIASLSTKWRDEIRNQTFCR